VKIYIDSTEPGVLFQDLTRRASVAGISVERTILHKREGLGGSARERHPFYGLGADFVIADSYGIALAAIERKTLEDFAKSAGIKDNRAPEGAKLFRQLRELCAHPMPVLVLEGSASALYRHAEPAMLGLQIWCAREGISILYSTGPLATAHAVVLLARHLGREMGLTGTDGTSPEQTAEGGSTLQ
jgi:hypothetical protein